ALRSSGVEALSVRSLDLELPTLRRCCASGPGADRLQEDVEGDHFRPKLEFSGLDLREIEHVVDELEQVLARLADVAEEALLPIAERGGDLFGEQPRKTKDRVEGRSEFMAHVREELGLHSSRRTEGVVRGSEIRI